MALIFERCNKPWVSMLPPSHRSSSREPTHEEYRCEIHAAGRIAALATTIAAPASVASGLAASD